MEQFFRASSFHRHGALQRARAFSPSDVLTFHTSNLAGPGALQKPGGEERRKKSRGEAGRSPARKSEKGGGHVVETHPLILVVKKQLFSGKKNKLEIPLVKQKKTNLKI